MSISVFDRVRFSGSVEDSVSHDRQEDSEEERVLGGGRWIGRRGRAGLGLRRRLGW